MKRIGVIGGLGPQATMDFEARALAESQRLIPQSWNAGYPPMVVWYHRGPPFLLDGQGAFAQPLRADPGLLEAAAQIGRWADFLVITANSPHAVQAEVELAAGCPVLSIIDATIREVRRRGWRKVGVLGYRLAPPPYLDALAGWGASGEVIGEEMQEPLDAAIDAVMEGRAGPMDREAARAAIAAMGARRVDGTIPGCSEIPLLLGADADAPNLVNPMALLAKAAVLFAAAEEAVTA